MQVHDVRGSTQGSTDVGCCKLLVNLDRLIAFHGNV